MKTLLAVITVIVAISSMPAGAADGPKTSTSIDERLTEMDLNVTLKQDEKVRTMQMDADLQMALGGSVSKDKAKEREITERRAVVLAKQAEELRVAARDYDSVLRKYRRTAAATAAASTKEHAH